MTLRSSRFGQQQVEHIDFVEFAGGDVNKARRVL